MRRHAYRSQVRSSTFAASGGDSRASTPTSGARCSRSTDATPPTPTVACASSSHSIDRCPWRRLEWCGESGAAVLRTALGAIANARPAIGLWTAAEASIDLLPYQLEPALAVLRGATRLLLADAVGLGKTIQAGLILAELRERGWAERALVLCPAGLRATWAAELQQRFHIDCAVLDQSAIAESVAALPPGINPWSSHATIVASIDFVKRPEVLAALAERAARCVDRRRGASPDARHRSRQRRGAAGVTHAVVRVRFRDAALGRRGGVQLLDRSRQPSRSDRDLPENTPRSGTAARRDASA